MTDSESHNGVAIALMLVTVVGASFIPLVIKWASGDESPFLLNAAWRIGVVLGCLLILAAFFGRFLLDEWMVLWQNRSKLLTWAVGGTIVGTLDYALFALSIRYIDIALSTVMIETYPIIVVFLIAFIDRKEQSRRRKIGGPIILLLTCFVGFDEGFLDCQSSGGAGGVGQFLAVRTRFQLTYPPRWNSAVANRRNSSLFYRFYRFYFQVV